MGPADIMNAAQHEQLWYPALRELNDYLLTLQSLQDESPIRIDDSYILAQVSTLPLCSEYKKGQLAKAGLKAVHVRVREVKYSQHWTRYVAHHFYVKLRRQLWLPSCIQYGLTSTSTADYGISCRALEANVNPPEVNTNNLSARNSMFLAQSAFHHDQARPLAISTYDRNGDQMAFPASSYYQQTTAYSDEQPHYHCYDSRRAPEVLSYNPKQGTEGSQVCIYLESTYNLTPSTLISLMFATSRCPSVLTQLGSRGSTYQYVLSTDVPAFSSTGWYSSRIPLQLHLHDNDTGMATGSIDLGSFTYTDTPTQVQGRTSPEDGPRKRKAPVDQMEFRSDLIGLPRKRSSYGQLISSAEMDAYQSTPYSKADSLLTSSGTASQPTTTLMPPLDSYGISQSQRNYPQFTRGLQTMTIGSPANSLLGASESSQPPVWYPPPSFISDDRSPSPAAITSSISPVTTSCGVNPPLVRTSTLPPGSHTRAFNPYTFYPHKAIIKINGDLNSMTGRWTNDEWSTKRRLVRFWRAQSGSTITTRFDRVTPEDRQPDSICVSCILWEERRKCFVTSVDTIYLLESLVAVRFTVEEKNRIRRNLEALHPLTVSKAKADTESFFRVIMSFPNPKPRNIEKDVKVFEWGQLEDALRKIIGKYVRRLHTFRVNLLLPIVARTL